MGGEGDINSARTSPTKVDTVSFLCSPAGFAGYGSSQHCLHAHMYTIYACPIVHAHALTHTHTHTCTHTAHTHTHTHTHTQHAHTHTHTHTQHAHAHTHTQHMGITHLP